MVHDLLWFNFRYSFLYVCLTPDLRFKKNRRRIFSLNYFGVSNLFLALKLFKKGKFIFHPHRGHEIRHIPNEARQHHCFLAFGRSCPSVAVSGSSYDTQTPLSPFLSATYICIRYIGVPYSVQNQLF